MPLVLVIEDDPDMRAIDRAVLESAGYAVVLASNGRQALAALEHWRPAVILLDLMMPVMDGLTFLAERQHRGLAEGVPVVCVTAAGEEMRRHALAMGASACLPKPTDFDDLCNRIARYCEGNQ